MMKDSLLFNLLVTALATIPAAWFSSFLNAHCKYYDLPMPLRIEITTLAGDPLKGPPRSLWEHCNPKERLMLVLSIDEALTAMKKNRAN